MKSNVLLIGNAGAGKSYLLNSIGGNFKSGFSAVNGLTTDYTKCKVKIGNVDVRLLDVPGLLEASGKRMAKNIREITKSLSQRGQFKVIFVLADNAGRVDPSDLYTIGKIMWAIDYSIEVGVIINKVPEEYIALYQDGSIREPLIQQLNSVANGKINSSWFMAIPRFHKNNQRDAESYMISLLSKMEYQSITTIRNIVSTMQEANKFSQFVTSPGALVHQQGKNVYQAFMHMTNGLGSPRQRPVDNPTTSLAECANGGSDPIEDQHSENKARDAAETNNNTLANVDNTSNKPLPDIPTRLGPSQHNTPPAN